MTMPKARQLAVCAVAAGLLFAAACATNPERAPVLAEAFAGPASLQLREALVARAPMVGQVSHGAKLEIIGRRRRFVKVRTDKGVEGWVDSRQLLATKDMEELRALAKAAAEAPSQGSATSFETLNAHTAPNRLSPSFFQVTPSVRVEVIAHQLAPRAPYNEPPFMDDLAARTKSTAAARPRKKKAVPTIPPPPAGPAPVVPKDWVSISGYPDGPPPQPVKPPPPPPPMDWWTLVRTKDGLAGWVLARLLYYSIPDEVAQYAERARITSYFPLGEVESKTKGRKQLWLWTTIRTSGDDRQFDQLRVFTWNAKRERYETAWIERDLSGWLPLSLKRASGGAVTGWTVLVQEKDGKLMRREYAWSGGRARIVSRTPGEKPKPWYLIPGMHPDAESDEDSGDTDEAQPETHTWRDELKTLWQRIHGRAKE